METTKGKLMCKGTINNPGPALLKCSANRKDDGEVYIEIHDKGLLEFSSKSSKEAKQHIEFDFDVKFAFTATPS